MYGNIYFVVISRNTIVMCWLLDIFVLQFVVAMYAVVAAVYSGLTIHFYKEVLDSKQRQTDTVRIIFLPLDKYFNILSAYKCV